MNLDDQPQAEYGDCAVLLAGSFNPPTNDHLRAVQALLAEPSIKHVWLAPLSGQDDEHVRNMTTIFCAELAAAANVRATACLVGLDKKIRTGRELLGKCRAMFPRMRFKLARLAPAEGIEDFMVVLGKGPGFYSPLHGRGPAKTIQLDRFLPVGDVVARIRDGKDESRSIPSSVWDYVQKNRLYRR